MANELDKTIEELEAEVLDELEEANGSDAPMKSAGKSDKMDKIKSDGATEDEGEIGGPTPTKDANQAGKIDPTKKVKKDSSAPAKTGGSAETGIKTTMKEDEDMDNKDKMEMDKEPKTKMEYMTAMKDMMMGMDKMKKEKLHSTYNAIKSAMHPEGAHEETEEEKAKSEAVENRLKSIDVSEHLEALISGEGDLSEEF